MASDGFLIHWKDHNTSQKHKFYEFYRNRELVDCTLQCQGVTLYAHSVILACGSSFFREIITHGTLNIVIEDVDLEIFELLVEFLYVGSVIVEIKQIRDLLSAAKKLGVIGLAMMEESDIFDNPENKSVVINSEDEIGKLIASQLPVDDVEKELGRRRSLLAEETKQAISRTSAESSRIVETLRRYSVLDDVRISAERQWQEDYENINGLNEDARAAATIMEPTRQFMGYEQEQLQHPGQSVVLVDEAGNVLGVTSGASPFFTEALEREIGQMVKSEGTAETKSISTEDASEGDPDEKDNFLLL